jgi:hypothetical protein
MILRFVYLTTPIQTHNKYSHFFKFNPLLLPHYLASALGFARGKEYRRHGSGTTGTTGKLSMFKYSDR